MNMNKYSGFTLIEVAIVLLIVSILLGYTVAMFPIQQELKQYRQANQEMDKIIDSLYAFAQVNGYLPCPASNSVPNSGFECRDQDLVVDGDCEGNDPAVDSCDIWFGFVPGKTLGLDGKYSAIGLLLDPWGMPYRYQVSDTDGTTGPIAWDFVMIGGIAEETIANLNPDLEVCNTDASAAAAGPELNCANAAQTVANTLPAVILSTGKNIDQNVAATSWIQRENLDNDPIVFGDNVFISVPFNDTQAAQYDDLVKWISPNILYSKMLESGQLP